jgi:hypothetical protein
VIYNQLDDRAELVKAHEAFHATMFRDVAIHMVGLNIRAITPDVAIATETENIDGFRTPDGTEAKAA